MFCTKLIFKWHYPILILWLYYTCTLTLVCYAQHPNLKQFNIEEGLSGTSAYDIKQDSKGYLWIATNGGISRFDGKNFKNYTTENGLQESAIYKLFIDKNDRVWFWNLKPKISYIENDSIITIHTIPSNNTYSMFDVKSPPTNTILDPSLPFKYLKSDSSIIFNTTRNFNYYTYHKGRSFVSHNNLLYVYSNNPYKPDTTFNFNFDVSTRVVQNNLGILCHSLAPKDLYLINDSLQVKKLSFAHIAPKSDNLLSHTTSQDDIIWINDNEKVYLCEWKEDAFYPIRSLIFEVKINAISEDHEGNTWFSTEGNGIYCLAKGAWAFQNYSKQDGLNDNHLFSINADTQNNIWLGLGNGKVQQINNLGQLSTLNIKQTREIIKIVPLRNKHMLFLSNNGISIINKKHQLVQKKDLLTCKTAYQNNDGFIWIGGISSASKYAPNNFDTPIEISPKYGRTYALLEHQDTLFLGTEKGLFYYHTKNKTSGNYKPNYPPLNVMVRDIIITKDQTKWIATVGNGVIALKNDTMYQLNKASHQLSHNSCRQLFYDEPSNAIWVSTLKGINKITNLQQVPQVAINTYTQHDGLVFDEATGIYVDKTNKVWISTKDGLSQLNEKETIKDTVAPLVYLTKFKVWEKDTLLQKKYDLAYYNNRITFNFNGVSFKTPISYKYRLQHWDEEWHNSDNNTARYTNLPPGKYIFEVKAINAYAIESAQTDQIHLHISLPFWKKWWFIIGSLCTLGLAIFMAINYQTKRIKQQYELKQLGLQGLKAQMNTHFLFNSLNAIQHFILKEDAISAYTYLSNFAQLVRQTLYYSEKSHISIEQEIKLLTNYLTLEQLRLNHAFDFTIYAHPTVYSNTQIPAMFIQPYAENAVRWGMKQIDYQGKITISFTPYNKSLIQCIIKDNGIGRKKAGEIKSKYLEQHQSMATKINDNRIELMQKWSKEKISIKIIDLYDNNNKALGTSVELLLPINS